jgi:hypothetical protein
MAVLVVNAGHKIITGRMIGGASPAQVEPTFMGWGTGAGTTAATDTTLFTEATYGGYARVSAATSQQTTSVTSDTYQLVATLTNSSGGGLTFTNAGTFDAATVGNLFVKGDFTGVPLNNGDSIAFTFKVQFS